MTLITNNNLSKATGRVIDGFSDFIHIEFSQVRTAGPQMAHQSSKSEFTGVQKGSSGLLTILKLTDVPSFLEQK